MCAKELCSFMMLGVDDRRPFQHVVSRVGLVLLVDVFATVISFAVRYFLISVDSSNRAICCLYTIILLSDCTCS